AELQKCVPIPAIARQARGLNREHRADRHQEFVKANARNTRSRMTLIIVDYRHFLPSDLTSAISESILADLALEVVGDLAWRGLTDIDDGTARKVLGSDLIHDRSPCWAILGLRRTRLPTIGCAAMARASLALSLLAEPLADSPETDSVDWTHVVFAWPPPSTESLEKELRRTSIALRRSRKFRTGITTRSRGLKTATSVL